MPTANSRRRPTRRHSSSAVGMATGAKGKWKGKGRLQAEEGEGQGLDYLTALPNAILGDIVSRLPTKDGARTQVLSPRWRDVWLSAPLNLDLLFHPIPLVVVPHILSSHGGPGRRFSTPVRCYEYEEEELSGLSAATLDGWLDSPALNDLQELDFGYEIPCRNRGNPPPLPTSAPFRFSRTLRIARFRVCRFPDGINIHLPLLQELGLSRVIISEGSLQTLLSSCPVMQTLMLTCNDGYSGVRIASPTLISIDMASGSGDLSLQRLIIEDAPCLERLNHESVSGKVVDILVISAPKLGTLGHLRDGFDRFQIGSTIFKGLRFVTMTAVVRSVKVIALTNTKLSLHVILNIMRCFPCLKELNIRTILNGKKNVWGPKDRNLINACEIHLKKLVLINYDGSESHVNFVKFFVLKARMLESISLKPGYSKVTSSWIEGQHRLLQFEKRASRRAQLEFVSRD